MDAEVREALETLRYDMDERFDAIEMEIHWIKEALDMP